MKGFSLYTIQKAQADRMKGIAMVLMVLHNYLNWSTTIGCNEIEFNPSRIFQLFSELGSDFSASINSLITYFAFYPMYIFIFISGYGLAKQYAKSDCRSYKNYLVPRLIKLYTLLVIGILFIVIFIQNPIYFAGDFDLRANLTLAIYYISMSGSFLKDTLFKFPLAGPWWYLALILQFYLIFPFIYRAIKRFKVKGFYYILAFSFVLIYALSPVFDRLALVMNTNFIAHLPIFILGIGIALYRELIIRWKHIIACAIIFILSNLYFPFYPLGFFAGCVLFLVTVYYITANCESIISKMFSFLGSISMFMFILNGPIRALTRDGILGLPNATSGDILRNSLIHLAIVIAISWIVSIVYNRAIQPLEVKLIRRLTKN